MFVVTNSTQTIWELAYKYYGTYNAVKQLIIDNPDTLDLDNAIAPGILIKITSFTAPFVEIPQQDFAEDTFVSHYEVAKLNQSLWDLALEYYGSYNAVKQLMLDNSGLDFTTNIIPGTKIFVTQKPLQRKMTDFLASKGYSPTTAMKIISNWILTNGIWEDSGIWVDTDFWND